MGLSDFIDNLRYIGPRQMLRELGEVFEESAEEFKELKQHGNELVTNGFHEMVIKGNDDYKTSVEKKKEADGIVSGSLVQSENKNRMLRLLLDQHARALDSHTEFLKGLFEWIIGTYEHSSLQDDEIDLKSFIETRGLKLRFIDFQPLVSIDELRDAINVATTESSIPEHDGERARKTLSRYFGTGPVWPIVQRARIEAADDYLADAEEFRLRTESRDKEREHLILAAIEIANQRIDEARAIIDVFRARMERSLEKSEATSNDKEQREFLHVSALCASVMLSLARVTLQPEVGEDDSFSAVLAEIEEVESAVPDIAR